MDPKLRATLEVAASAFVVGLLDYLKPLLNGPLPPRAEWTHILGLAAISGAMMAYHRVFPSPSQTGGSQ